MCRISTETEWKAATDQVNSASEARKPTKKKKNSNKKKKEGGINELAIILQNILNSSFPGRDVWCVGGWVCGGFGTTLTLARSWARKRAKFHESSALKGISVWCTMFYPPCPPPSTIHCYFILPYAIAHTNPIQAVSSISSLTMRPHVECLAAPSPVDAPDYAR